MDLIDLRMLCVCFFIIFGTKRFAVNGNCGEDVSAIQICSKAHKTGRILHIDTTAVPKSMLVGHICSCSVSTTSQFHNILLVYNVNGTSDCGIQINVSNTFFKCGTYNTYVSAIHQIILKKTSEVIQGTACLTIYMDHKFNDSETNARVTVNCYSSNPDATTISSSSVSTIYPSSPSVGTRKTAPTATSPTVGLSTQISTTNTENETEKTSTKAAVISTSSTAGSSLPPTEENNPDDSNQTVIIAASTGAAGGFLLLVTTILSVCCYRNRQIPRSTLSKKDEYVNSASDHVVTDNVVYNMEFTDDTKRPQVAVYDRRTKHQSEEKDVQAIYKNLQIDEDEGTYNTVFVDAEHVMKIDTPLNKNTFKIDDDVAYNTVEFQESPRAPNTKLNGSQNTDDTMAYKRTGQENNTYSTEPSRAPVSKPDKKTDITYAVGDNGKPSDLNYNRPKQFQVAESGDTYAIVNKETVK